MTCVLKTFEFIVLFKFLVAILLAIICIGLTANKIKKIIQLYFAINIIYGILVLASPDKAYAYMGDSVNYLNMTLTLGFCLTLSLVGTVINFFYNRYNNLLFSVCFSIFFFIVIMLFAARGVLLFPPLIAILIALLNRKTHNEKFIVFFIGLSICIGFAVQYFLNNASTYALAHMSNLFEKTEDESRLVVWSTAINAALDHLWIFWGGGINCIVKELGFYPHNIFLHILIDYGIIGCCGLIYITRVIFKRFLKFRKQQMSMNIKVIEIMCFAGYLYYLLTFCKSFSMYDSCPLLILMSFCLTIDNNEKEELRMKCHNMIDS